MATVLVLRKLPKTLKQFINYEKRKESPHQMCRGKEFFNEISDLITSGHDKVWTSKDENGEMNFIVGNSRVNIRINASMMKGGTL